MNLFDTHAHLNDEQLAGRETEVIETALAVGVSSITAIGTDLLSSGQCVEIARRQTAVHASAGIHPNSCHLASDSDWEGIQELAADPLVVAIGETGLDCYWDDCPLTTQREWFVRHIELSFQTGKPLVVHLRDSEQEILNVFEEQQRHGSIHGIMHSFTGSWESAKCCLDYGMYISFAGMVTFKNAGNLREIAKKIPSDRILIETDSPYLTPHPHRGVRPNEPKMVIHTAQCLAAVRGVSVTEFAAMTMQYGKQVFGVNC